MPTIKPVHHLYLPDLKVNQQGQLSKFQKSRLWQHVWWQLPGTIILTLIVIIPLGIGMSLLLREGAWQIRILLVIVIVPIPLLTSRLAWTSLIEIKDLLLDISQKDIISQEATAKYYKGKPSFNGVVLNHLIPHPFVFDGQSYKVYFLRRSRVFLTYEEITAMKH